MRPRLSQRPTWLLGVSLGLEAGPDGRNHSARRLDVSHPQGRTYGAAIGSLPRYVDDHRRRRVRRAAIAEIFDRMHVGDGGEVLVCVGASVLSCITIAANGATDEQLTNPIAIAMGRDGEGIREDADFHPIDPDWIGPDRCGLETDIPKIQSVNGTLEGLDGLYGPASILPDQRAAGGVISSLFQIGDGRCGQPVGVLWCDQAAGDAPPGVLVLDDQRPGVAGIFGVSQDTELRQLRSRGQIVGQLRGGQPGFRPEASGRTSHG